MKIKLAATLILGLLLIGCSVHSVEPLNTTELPSRSGFLSSYSQLAPSKNKATESAWVYKNPSVSISIYKMVMLDPVQVVLKSKEAPTAETKAKLDLIALRLEQQFRGELGHSFPVVGTPGFGVMRIRAAITEVDPGITNLRGASERTGGGIVGIELELIDSQKGTQIAAAVDKKEALRTEDILHTWAFLLRDALDESRGLHRGTEVRGSGDIWR